MQRARHTTLLLAITFLSISALAGCGGNAAPNTTPPVITVVQTVPVEVTRIVEIPVTVEVTRQVVITQVVEVPVTLTSTSVPLETATPTAAPLTFVPLSTYVPTITPGGVYTDIKKVNGTTLLMVRNETDRELTVDIAGPVSTSLLLYPDGEASQIVPEGAYTYRVLENSLPLYSGSFRLTNPDKHELLLRENKAVLWLP